MPESYSRIQSRIAQLQRQAEALRRNEMAGVIRKIKVAIEAYGIQPDDLFGGGGAARFASAPRRGRPTGDAEGARYADGNGNVWGGRGPRPRWLRDAIASGKSLEDFASGQSAPAKAPQRAARKRGAASGKGVAIKYRDGDNTWTGRGSQPRWLRAALSEGKSLEQFMV